MMNRFLWIPPVLWGLIIIFLSLLPGGPGHLQMFGIPHFDKIGHFGMYAIWSFLIARSLHASSRRSSSSVFWLSFFIGTMIGIVLEFGQDSITDGRSFEVADMIANGVGSFVGALVGRRQRPEARS